jgi:hypothetical protein
MRLSVQTPERKRERERERDDGMIKGSILHDALAIFNMYVSGKAPQEAVLMDPPP